MKLDKNYKVRVTPEQSRQIQELAFELGFEWYFSGKQILHAEICNLVLNNNYMVLSYFENNKKFYADTRFAEISADDLIALLTDLSKSAETPLQNIELTPEFEVVEPVLADNSVNIQDIGTDILDTNADIKDTPKFKVGDKVYTGIDEDIKVIKQVKEKFVVAPSIPFLDTHYPISEVCHATPENYEMLCKLYPHIKFEAPPKPLTGSDLARAMLDKGWQYIPCYVSNYGESEAQKPCIVRKFSSSGQFVSEFEFYNNAVPFDPRTGEPLTESILND